MINYIFGIFIIVGVVYSFLTGNGQVINDSLLSSGGVAIEMIFKMVPLLCLWLGVMKIAEESGLLLKISGFFSRVLHPLFPELKKGGEAISYIASNMAMNMLGLDVGPCRMPLYPTSEANKELLKAKLAECGFMI